MTTIRIPSIAGARGNSWDQRFTPHIASYTEDGKPKAGSFGVNFEVTENLQGLASRHQNSKDAMIEHLITTYQRQGDSLTRLAAKNLLDFFFWSNGDQPYFYLRKGMTTLGLYKKTSKYVYTPSVPPCRHRVSYEFVSAAPPEASQGLGSIPPALVWKDAVVPATVPPPTSEERIEELEARLGRIHAAIVTFTADITEAMDRLSAAL